MSDTLIERVVHTPQRRAWPRLSPGFVQSTGRSTVGRAHSWDTLLCPPGASEKCFLSSWVIFDVPKQPPDCKGHLRLIGASLGSRTEH